MFVSLAELVSFENTEKSPKWLDQSFAQAENE